MQDSPPKEAEESCESKLEKLIRLVGILAPKAAKWDALTMACHRLGIKCHEIVKYIRERVQW